MTFAPPYKKVVRRIVFTSPNAVSLRFNGKYLPYTRVESIIHVYKNSGFFHLVGTVFLHKRLFQFMVERLVVEVTIFSVVNLQIKIVLTITYDENTENCCETLTSRVYILLSCLFIREKIQQKCFFLLFLSYKIYFTFTSSLNRL